MNLIADESAQDPVDELVPCQRSLAGELPGHHERLEMCVVITFDPDERFVETGLDQARYVSRVHILE